MPGSEPAAINRHEVNKVADAGAWDKTENLPLLAWAGAKAHPWKGISPSPPLPCPLASSCPYSGLLVFALWQLPLRQLCGEASLGTCQFLQAQDGRGGGISITDSVPPLSPSSCSTLCPQQLPHTLRRCRCRQPPGSATRGVLVPSPC